MKKTFRQFVNELFLEHKDEILEMTGQTVEEDARRYFQRNKWFLRKKFKEKNL